MIRYRVHTLSFRRPTVHGAFIGALVAGMTAAYPSQKAPAESHRRWQSSESRAAGVTTGRLRERTTISERLGSFQIKENRVTFATTDGKYRFGALENLNLERVVRTIRDNPEKLVWSMSGTITEYHGSNYVLISRVVLKTGKTGRTARRRQGPGRNTARR